MPKLSEPKCQLEYLTVRVVAAAASAGALGDSAGAIAANTKEQSAATATLVEGLRAARGEKNDSVRGVFDELLGV